MKHATLSLKPARAAFLAGVLAAAGAASAQVSFIGTFNGHDYYRQDTRMSWTDARAFANAFNPGNSYLVSINDIAEQAFLNSVIGHVQNVGPVMWIGLSAEDNPGGGIGAFNTWESGEPVTYTNWAGDAQFTNPARIYTSFNWNVDGVWSNLGNNGEPFNDKPFIIEVVPTPGVLALAGLGGALVLRRRR